MNAIETSPAPLGANVTCRVRAVALAGAVGLAGLAALVATHRPHDPAGAVRIDRLHAEEARLVALHEGSDAITFPRDLLARRGEPAVASAMKEAQQGLLTERERLMARRDAIAQQISEARADRDLFEARNIVQQMKLVEALSTRDAARQRRDRIATATLDQQVDTLQRETVATSNGAADASRRANRLSVAMSNFARTTQAAAAGRLAAVRARLSDAGA